MKIKKLKLTSVNEYFSLLFSNLLSNYRNVKFSIKNFITPQYPKWRSTLPRHKYFDIPHLIVESNLNLLLDFDAYIHKNNWVDWESDDQLKKFYDELTKNVFWLKNERNNLSKQIEKQFFNISSDVWLKNDPNKYKEVNDLEKEKEQKETEILNWMIQNRSFFWT